MPSAKPAIACKVIRMASTVAIAMLLAGLPRVATAQAANEVAVAQVNAKARPFHARPRWSLTSISGSKPSMHWSERDFVIYDRDNVANLREISHAGAPALQPAKRSSRPRLPEGQVRRHPQASRHGTATGRMGRATGRRDVQGPLRHRPMPWRRRIYACRRGCASRFMIRSCAAVTIDPEWSRCSRGPGCRRNWWRWHRSSRGSRRVCARAPARWASGNSPAPPAAEFRSSRVTATIGLTRCVPRRLRPNFCNSNYQALGSWPLAITAYNYGTAGMERAASEFGKDYVKIVQNYNGEHFGFAAQKLLRGVPGRRPCSIGTRISTSPESKTKRRHRRRPRRQFCGASSATSALTIIAPA